MLDAIIYNAGGDSMINPFNRVSFQYLFFFTFLLFALLLILFLGTTSNLIANQEVVKQETATRKLLLGEINKQLFALLQSIEYDSLQLTGNADIVHYLQNPEDSFERIRLNSAVLTDLSRPSYLKESIHSIQLYPVDTQAGPRIGANGIFGYDIALQSSWYDQIRRADNCWIGAHPVEAADYSGQHQTVVSFARKIQTAGGKELGILIINVKISSIQEIISSGSEGAFRYIVDGSKRFVTSTVDGTQHDDPYENHKAEVDRAIDRNVNGEHYDVLNLERKELVIWNGQDKNQWTIIDIIPWNDVTRGTLRMRRVILIACLCCVLLAVAVAIVLTRQFVKPIRDLIGVMSQVKKGKLDVQIANHYNNEFGHLYGHFNHMFQRINQLMREVNEQNRRKREARMQVLQAQINPHFIYNTLDVINWHAIEFGAKDVSRMLSLLGKMLRIGLSRGSLFITVEREKEHLNSYIELQKIRYHHRIAFHVSIPDSIGHYYVSKLLLQPFVENALIHAFTRRERGKIAIAGADDGQELVFTIADDGHGFDASACLASSAPGGIRNVDERLRLYHGPGYGIRIASGSAGTTVTVRVPKMASAPIDDPERKDSDV